MLQRIGIIALLALVVGCEVAASPADIVRKAYSAEKTAVFSGKLTNTVNMAERNQNATVTIYRSNSKLRMEYTSGSMNGVVVIEDGKSVYTLVKSSKMVYVAIPPPATDHVKLLLSNYIPVTSGKEKVAERVTDIIRLQPKTPGNPKLVLWVDEKTGIILRSERYLHTGTLATRSTYNSISFKPVVSTTLYAVPKQWRRVNTGAASNPISADQVQKSAGFKPLKPSYVPKGYVLDGYFLRRTGSGKIAAVLKYTDGLNSITVFERECGNGQGRGKGMGYGRRMRAGNMGMGKNRCMTKSEPFGIVGEAQVNSIMITVTADLNPSQIQKIANSF
jgi:outer membrane lipoprotein-sorting protein